MAGRLACPPDSTVCPAIKALEKRGSRDVSDQTPPDSEGGQQHPTCSPWPQLSMESWQGRSSTGQKNGPSCAGIRQHHIGAALRSTALDRGVQESMLRKTLDNKAIWPQGHGSSLSLSRRVLEAGDGSRISEFPTETGAINRGCARVLPAPFPGELMLLRKHLRKSEIVPMKNKTCHPQEISPKQVGGSWSTLPRISMCFGKASVP